MENSQQQSKGLVDVEIFGYAIKKSSTARHHLMINADKLITSKPIILNLAHHQEVANDQGHNAIKQGTTHTKNALRTANAWEGSKCKSIQLKSEN